MGKVEIGINCYLTADILSSPLPTVWILSKPLNLIGCHDNQNAKFAKKYSKIFSSEVIRGMKQKKKKKKKNQVINQKLIK